MTNPCLGIATLFRIVDKQILLINIWDATAYTPTYEEMPIILD